LWLRRSATPLARVAEQAAPARADEGGAEEAGRVPREAEKDLGEEVVVVQRQRWRLRRVRSLPRPGDHASHRAAGWGLVWWVRPEQHPLHLTGLAALGFWSAKLACGPALIYFLILSICSFVFFSLFIYEFQPEV